PPPVPTPQAPESPPAASLTPTAAEMRAVRTVRFRRILWPYNRLNGSRFWATARASVALRMLSLWLYADALRRCHGDLLDQLGWGPHTSPSRLVQRLRRVDLLAFHDARATGPTLLIVPAP